MKRMEVATSIPPATQPRMRKIEALFKGKAQPQVKDNEGTMPETEILILMINLSGGASCGLLSLILNVQVKQLGWLLQEVSVQVIAGGQFIPSSVKNSGWYTCSMLGQLGSEKATLYSNSFPSQEFRIQQQGRLDDRGCRQEWSVAMVAGVLQLKMQPNMQVQQPQEEQQAFVVLAVQFEEHCCRQGHMASRRRSSWHIALILPDVFIKNIQQTNHHPRRWLL